MRRRRAIGTGSLVLIAMLGMSASAGRGGELETAPEGLDARTLAHRAAKNSRSSRTSLVARLTVRAKASARPKEYRFELWDDRAEERVFLRVVDAKDVVINALLKLPPNLWSYTAGDSITRRIQPSELHQGWLEGDFSIDDFVHASRLAGEYEYELIGVARKPDGIVDRRAHVVAYVPIRSSQEHWGRIVDWIDTEWGTSLRREYYDSEGELVRVLQFGAFREVQGRFYPHVWTARVPGDSGRESRVDVERIDFVAEIADSHFDISNLKPTE